MSALGHKQTFAAQKDVRFTPDKGMKCKILFILLASFRFSRNFELGMG